MKNKVFAGLTSMALVAALALPAAAAAPTNSNQTTNLTSFKESAYTLSIPASISVDYGVESTSIGDLKVVGNVDVGNYVTVDAELNAFVRTGDTDYTIAFSLMDHSSETAVDFEATTWDEAALRAENKVVPLTVDIPTETWDGAKAGSYTGSIVFKAAYNAPSAGGPIA